MIALLQRVREARVEVDDKVIGQIQCGLLVFAGFEPDDNEEIVSKQLDRVMNYRVFADSEGKMNLSLKEVNGGLLLVPQFTLAADTQRGRRPSFTTAATPQKGMQLFDYLLDRAAQFYPTVASGKFGADMQVYLQNDGPVTFILQ